jgi:type II secretory pathway pseudopilin PulG
MPTPRTTCLRLRRCPASDLRGMRNEHAMTVLELLMVSMILIILFALSLPLVGMVRNRVHSTQARATLTQLWLAVQEYANDHPWHLYPTPQPDRWLSADASRPGAVLTQLLAAGLPVSSQGCDLDPASPSYHCLLDPWHRPYCYQIDGPRLAANGTLDAGSMDGVAERPAPLPRWNPSGAEPFAYLWSLGPVHGTSSQDAEPANATSWVYAAGVR